MAFARSVHITLLWQGQSQTTVETLDELRTWVIWLNLLDFGYQFCMYNVTLIMCIVLRYLPFRDNLRERCAISHDAITHGP